MSEQPNPPPLRLKPRLRPDATDEAAKPAEPEAPASAEPTVDESAESPRLRLKPRLTPEPVEEKPAEPEQPAAVEEKPAAAAPAT
jgi:hypothetical protein